MIRELIRNYYNLVTANKLDSKYLYVVLLENNKQRCQLYQFTMANNSAGVNYID